MSSNIKKINKLNKNEIQNEIQNEIKNEIQNEDEKINMNEIKLLKSSQNQQNNIIKWNWDRDNWKVLDILFKDISLIRHQTESFNDFIDVLIPQIIERNNPIVINLDRDNKLDLFRKKYEIKFGKTFISKPIINEKIGRAHV